MMTIYKIINDEQNSSYEQKRSICKKILWSSNQSTAKDNAEIKKMYL